MTQILIVEPNQYFTNQLRPQLKSTNIVLAETVSSIELALAQINLIHPDVVLLDQIISSQGIYDSAQKIRNISSTIKILILGNDSCPECINWALSVGANGYLSRQISSAELVKAIEKVVLGYFQSSSSIIAHSVTSNGVVATRSNTVDDLPKNSVSTLVIPGAREASPMKPVLANALPQRSYPEPESPFAQSAILRPTTLWWRLLTWCLLILVGGLVAWANWFQIEEAVSAQGQLEPEGAVREVQAPMAGVVQLLNIKDGQTVTKGQTLLRLDRKVNQSQLQALQKIRGKLVVENQFYQQQLQNTSQHVSAIPNGIPSQIISLTRSRQSLLSDNQFYRTQIQGGSDAHLSADQKLRLQSSRQEEKSRMNAVQYQIEQLNKQRQQAEIQLASNQQVLIVNQGILADIEPVQKEGAISKVQYLRQYQEVQRGESEVKRFEQEINRINAQISQAKEEISTIKSTTLNAATARLSENEQQIAEIDGQLTKIIVENQKQIEDIDSRINRIKSDLVYQQIQAPVSGIIFDLKPKSTGFVANMGETLFKIVPSDTLIAKVYISNRDIGFIRPKMVSDVRIDAFPFSEFGDIKGELIWIGSDALPPTEIRKFYSFPAKIKLTKQKLRSKDHTLSLQSGMAVNVNIKVRQRSIISIFTDFFVKEAESVKHLR